MSKERIFNDLKSLHGLLAFSRNFALRNFSIGNANILSLKAFIVCTELQEEILEVNIEARYTVLVHFSVYT